jgi:fatty acid desaturase
MQMLVIMIVTGGAEVTSLALLPFVSAATFGLFLSQLRGLAEHGVHGGAVPAGLVRSHAPRWVERLFLYDLHFNYHAAHHAWPQCPSCHLRTVHQRYFAGSSPLEPSMLATVAAISVRSNREQG